MPADLTEKIARKAEPRDKPYEIVDRGGRESVRELRLRIQPSGIKTFYVQISRGKRERLGTFPGYSLGRARTEAIKKLGKAADGYDFQAERRIKRILKDTTLQSYLEGPFKEHAEENIASHKGMLANVKRAFGFLLEKPMTEINDTMDMARWRKLRAKLSPETRRRDLTYLKAVLNHAVKNKVIPGHQLMHYRAQSAIGDGESSPRVRYLTESEEKRLRAALDVREARLRKERASANRWRAERGYGLKPEIGPLQYADHIKPMVLLALNTGLRRGDLFGLQWKHVDLERRQIRKVIEKTSHARRKASKSPVVAELPLSAEAHAVLSQCERQRDEGSEYVFPSPRSRGRLDNINKAWDAVLKGAKIDNFRFHDLRHTFASRLVMAGVDINTVRELMTHSDIKMTLVYAHLSPDHKAAALEKAFGAKTS